MIRTSRKRLTALVNLPTSSTSSVVPVTAAELKASRHRQYRSSKDIVAQSVLLSRISHEPAVWQDLAVTVTQSVAKLKGEDLASILKSCAKSGFRDELMLTAICESLKTLPTLRLLRIADIASLVNSFYRLNFVPSVEVLNIVSAEILRSLPMYRTRSADLCHLLRYFSVLSSNPSLVLHYESQFQYPQIVSALEEQVIGRIGTMGPVEMCVIARHARRVSLPSLVANFARSENVLQKVKEFFIRSLDHRFGKDAWMEYAHLFRVGDTDSTGWDRTRPPVRKGVWDDDEEKESAVANTRGPKFERFQLDDSMVRSVLGAVPLIRAGRVREATDAPNTTTQLGFSDEQMDFIKSLEDEMGMPPTPTLKPYIDKLDGKTARHIEEVQLRETPVSGNITQMQQFKRKRNRRLFKFAILSYMKERTGSH